MTFKLPKKIVRNDIIDIQFDNGSVSVNNWDCTVKGNIAHFVNHSDFISVKAEKPIRK